MEDVITITLDQRLIARVIAIDGRRPTVDEVKQYAICAVDPDTGAKEYFWRGKTLLKVPAPPPI